MRQGDGQIAHQMQCRRDQRWAVYVHDAIVKVRQTLQLGQSGLESLSQRLNLALAPFDGLDSLGESRRRRQGDLFVGSTKHAEIEDAALRQDLIDTIEQTIGALCADHSCYATR